ncbi:MAG: hypothetical protein V1646_00410 [bacterium]
MVSLSNHRPKGDGPRLGKSPIRLLRKSFSLVELLIFLSLILVMVTIAVPRLDFFSNYLLSHELNKIFVTFSYLQQKAIASNKKYSIVFDQINNSYSYQAENSNIMIQLAEGVSFGFIDGVMGPPSSPTKKIEKFINLEKIINNSDRKHGDEMSFWPNGRISHGTIYLVDKSHKRMGALTCSVSQVSYIRRYKCENSVWKIFGT